jgi:TctA family transporter
LLGYVLGPLVEENFRRALLLSRGDMTVFFTKPISLGFMSACILLVGLQVFFALRRALRARGFGLRRERLATGPGSAVDLE